MKRTVSAVLGALFVVAALSLSSCDIVRDLKESVSYPDSYSLTYEITSAQGVISTITKTIDESGNVYYKTAEEEKLYIHENGSYTLYEQDENGVFAVSSGEKYTKKAVEEATSGICAYAEESRNKLMPTAKKDGEGEVAGRTCDIYKLGVGNEDNGSYHYYYVDRETGICLRLEVRQVALGQDVEYNGEHFVCTELVTENVEDLSNRIAK